MKILRLKSINTTTNIYVKREYLIQNLTAIKKYLNSYKGSSIGSNDYWRIVDIKKEQTSLLSKINLTIKQSEQGTFFFGS